MNKEILKLTKISKKFTGSRKDIVVLKNVNFKINKGDLETATLYGKRIKEFASR